MSLAWPRAVPALALALSALLAACSDAREPEVDPAAVLERAATRLERASSYRFLLEFDGGAAPITLGLAMRRAEGVFAGADNFDATVLAAAGPLDARVGMRAVNGETWMTNPITGGWMKQPISVAQLFDLSTGVPALMRGATEPHAAAEESLDGVAVRRIDATLPSERFTLLPGIAPGQQLRASAWIGTEDDLVRRLEVRGRGTPFAKTADTEGTVRLTLSGFDEPVALAPPS
jgi:hypothetical protein